MALQKRFLSLTLNIEMNRKKCDNLPGKRERQNKEEAIVAPNNLSSAKFVCVGGKKNTEAFMYHGASKEIQQGDYPKKYLAYILGSALLQKRIEERLEGERLIYQAFEV